MNLGNGLMWKLRIQLPITDEEHSSGTEIKMNGMVFPGTPSNI